MYVASIELNNWARYAGKVSVTLGPEVYAVEAQWHDDDDRSNWGGKSKLVEAIPFAFYGWHRDKGQGAGSDDLIVTHGQDEGGVKITLSTGHVVHRWKPRGKPMKLHLYVPGLDKPAVGDAAQELIDQLLGLSQKDFLATCFMRQKQIAKFVTGDPGERNELILEWCQLRPLERAAKRAVDALTAAIQKREKAEQRVVALQEVLGRYLPGTYGARTCQTGEDLAGAVAELRSAMRKAEGRVALFRQQREAFIAWEARAKALAEQEGLGKEVEQVRQEAEKLRKAVPPMPDLTPLFSAHQAAAAELRQKSALAAGRFDGKCPVGGVACPITEQLNTSRDANTRARDAAAKVEREARTALEEGQRQVSQVREAERAAERAEARHRALADQAARVKAERVHGARPEPPNPGEVVEAERALTEARRQLAQAEEAERQVLAVAADISKARDESAKLAVEVAELRGAAVALGRTGAQKIVGSAMVGAVERAANAELGAAGVGLVVRVPWERDGAKLAPECEACGWPIKGEAAKSCPRCAAPRGKQVIQGPFVSLSDRSGAAEDLAGLTLQLAASSWLRRRRSIAWSSMVLDEPFGALDAANRTAIAAHLLAMLKGRHGASQAFVIAHHRGVLDAMPARIIVKAGPTGSTLEVSR